MRSGISRMVMKTSQTKKRRLRLKAHHKRQPVKHRGRQRKRRK